MFWHIYIPEFINSKAEPLENKNSLPISKKELNNNYIYTHYSGKIKEELFPQLIVHFGIDLVEGLNYLKQK